jgi:hypothetical protein
LIRTTVIVAVMCAAIPVLAHSWYPLAGSYPSILR